MQMETNLFIQGESREVNYFLSKLGNGELETLKEYAKGIIVDFLGDITDEDKEEYLLLENYISDKLHDASQDGGFEMWYATASQYIAKWVLEEYDDILKTDSVDLYNRECKDKNICLLHYAIVESKINEILAELSEGATMDDIEAFKINVSEY